MTTAIYRHVDATVELPRVQGRALGKARVVPIRPGLQPAPVVQPQRTPRIVYPYIGTGCLITGLITFVAGLALEVARAATDWEPYPAELRGFVLVAILALLGVAGLTWGVHRILREVRAENVDQVAEARQLRRGLAAMLDRQAQWTDLPDDIRTQVSRLAAAGRVAVTEEMRPLVERVTELDARMEELAATVAEMDEAEQIIGRAMGGTVSPIRPRRH